MWYFVFMTHPGPESYIRSPDNPNGLFDAILDPSFTDSVPDFNRRLAIVSADITIYLTDVLGVDKEMAGIVAARAVQETLAATAITLESSELTAIFTESERLTNL
jgi:hypothetical protein